MRFTNIESAKYWQKLPLDKEEGNSLWGGEPAAAILTNQLSPEKFSIYTNESWQNIGQGLGLVPESHESVEILEFFLKDNNNAKKRSTCTIGLRRFNRKRLRSEIEIVKIILENELQHIK
ncbi:MAG: type IV toxin-antitoxin system AbiEi family antitoxin [Paludibacter sp.]